MEINNIKTSLSIVVIGRNEGENIESLAASIAEIRRLCACTLEAIFVDSASIDNSVYLAKAAFDVVIELEESTHLCASAGRAVGTREAKGEWILYLDADMALTPEFTRILEALCHNAEPTTAGYIGSYNHVFENGEQQITRFCARNRKNASGLGGASLLRRSAVLDAGNWDASVFSNEELDLFSRMRKNYWEFAALDTPMILHFTEKLSLADRLAFLLLPNGGSGKKYFGPGQLFASRIFNRQSGWDVIKQEPFAAIIAVAFITAFMIGIMTSALYGLAILSVMLVAITLRIGASGLAVHGSKLIRIPFGILKYRRNFNPTIKSIWIRNVDIADR